MSKINIIFFGSSIYSNIILEQLANLTNFNILSVVTKPDKPVGRSQKITSNPVSGFAKENNLPLLQPANFDQNFTLTFQNLNPDLALCVAYGPPFFSQTMIDVPKYKIVNIHPSSLPKYRGATPGPWQIINGEKSSSACFFQIDSLPDHGPIITQIPFEIQDTWTSHDFYQHAFSLAARNLNQILKTYVSGLSANQPILTSQDHSQKTYFPKFTRQTAKIDWSWPPDKINRFIRAMNPWPIAWTQIKNNQNQILAMKVFSGQITHNKLQPLQVQIASKTKTDWNQIKNHYRIID